MATKVLGLWKREVLLFRERTRVFNKIVVGNDKSEAAGKACRSVERQCAGLK